MQLDQQSITVELTQEEVQAIVNIIKDTSGYNYLYNKFAELLSSYDDKMRIKYTKEQAIEAVELPHLKEIWSYGPLGRTDIYICYDKRITKDYIRRMNKNGVERYTFIFRS